MQKVIFLLTLAVLGYSQTENFRKAPYLIYTGIGMEISVNWQLKDSMMCQIEWGDDNSYSIGKIQVAQYGDDHQFKYVILAPQYETKYYYRVIAGNDTIGGSATTGPLSDALNIKFFVYGDTRTYPSKHNSVAAQIIAEYQADDSLQTILISSGDLVQNGDLETHWDIQFFDPFYKSIQQILSELQYIASMGNHEYSGALFKKYFPYPFYFADRFYWSFDYGPAHFAVVDQYTSYGTGSEQYQWLENDLATSDKTWKFIVLHEPGWSAGGGHENNTNVQNYIQPLCEQYGVAMVFAGHNHYYARALVNGVYHMTTGGGGAPLHWPESGHPNVQKTSFSHHFCEVNIRGDSLDFTAINISGTVIDEFSIENSQTGIGDAESRISDRHIILLAPTPNPFNPGTDIHFILATSTEIELSICDITGKKVNTLVRSLLPAGEHQYRWNGTDDRGGSVSSGIYIVFLRSPNETSSQKIVFLK